MDERSGMITKARLLARAVRYRRIQLGYDPMRLWPETARLSPGTIRKIESGRFTNLHGNTIIKLELDLCWEPGRVDSIWAGGNPTIINRSA